MTSCYTVVQYLPHPLSEERINVGVIAWDEHGMSSRFVTNWHRVQAFGNEDIGYLREFVAKVERVTAGRPQLSLLNPGEAPLTPSAIEKIVEAWRHSIQLTPVRGSLKDRLALLADVGPIYLTHPSPEKYVPRGKRTAARIAAQSVLAAVTRRDPLAAKKMVKTNWIVPGKYDTHEFPVVVANGRALAAVEALSFEVRENRTLEWEMRSVLWACDDVRQKNSKIRLAVFAIEPRRPSALFERTTKVLRKLHINLVTENNVERWANRQVASELRAPHGRPYLSLE
jgi:hypothetical protein